jgi:ABC-type phosphate transport system substrate-binding protein
MQMLFSPSQLFVRAATRPSARRLVALSLLFIAMTLVVWPAPAGETAGFRVIVNTQNPVNSAKVSFVADAFLKKVNDWSDGQPVQPADQKASNESRRLFSLVVLGRSVAAVRTYWQQRVFSGRGVPPPELEGDVEVMRYVSTHRGAIGYVSDAAKLDGVKVLTIQ